MLISCQLSFYQRDALKIKRIWFFCVWYSRDISTGTISYVTLDQIIDEEIIKNGKK